jgi:peptidoglycan/LPS O-acetylase OafA/YrhL
MEQSRPVPAVPLPPLLSQYLDAARWISAALVVITHVNNRMFEPSAGSVAGRTLAQKAWIFLCGFGHQGLVVFFVLSGFLVGGRLIRDMRAGEFRAPVYLADRVSRIHTVLIPVIAATLLLDMVGASLVPEIYPGAEHYGPAVVVGNLLVLQDFVVPVLGSNGPLGTLSNEFWYYLAFPFLFAPLHPRFGGRAWLGVAAAVGVTVWLGWVRPWHLHGALLWLIGAVAAAAPRPVRSHGLALVALMLAVLLCERLLIRATAPELVHFAADVVLALAFAASCWGLRVATRWQLSPRFAAANQAIAGFSYSLYALHVPVIMVFIAVSVRLTGFGWQTSAVSAGQWGAVALCIATAFAAAYLLSAAVEMRTAAVRRWLRAQCVQLWPRGHGIFAEPPRREAAVSRR